MGTTGYWTERRRAKLLAQYPRKNQVELMRVFKRPWSEINEVYEFAVAHKRLLLSVTIENGVRVTRYAPAHARGTSPDYDDDNPAY